MPTPIWLGDDDEVQSNPRCGFGERKLRSSIPPTDVPSALRLGEDEVEISINNDFISPLIISCDTVPPIAEGSTRQCLLEPILQKPVELPAIGPR